MTCERCHHPLEYHYSDGGCCTTKCDCKRNYEGKSRFCVDCGVEYFSGWGKQCSGCYWGVRCDFPYCFEKPGHEGNHKDLFKNEFRENEMTVIKKYELHVEYQGAYDSVLDKVIEETAGGDWVSSGYYVGGTRDIQFRFDTEIQATEARKRLLYKLQDMGVEGLTVDEPLPVLVNNVV